MSTEKQWWEPTPDVESPERWLCDHEGDWSEKADALWKEITRLRARVAELEGLLQIITQQTMAAMREGKE